MKTAIIVGATGMVGRQLIQLLLQDTRFGKLLVFGRRSLGIHSAKLEEHIIDFDNPDSWKDLVKGDILFSTLGTTIKQAGSKQAQYQIDHNYQYWFARAAAKNKVPVYVLVSSSGADPNSKIFYSRMKGELERDVKKLPFEKMYLLQPSLLVGSREKERFGEKLGYSLLKTFNKIGLFNSYRPIHGKVVAKAMINAGIEDKEGIHTFTLGEVFTLAEKK